MKLLVLLSLSSLFVAARAQVNCLNPGSVEIPYSPCCDQVPGVGLAGALNDFFNLMDLKCKVDMFFDAVLTDPDMLAFFNYVTGPEFQGLVLSVQNMPEWKEFMEYLCGELQLDAYLYLNTLSELFGNPIMEHPEGPQCHVRFPVPWMTSLAQKIFKLMTDYQMTPANEHASGVKIFMDSLKAEIPNDAIYEMWTDKVQNDDELCRGYLKMSSPAFRAVALKVEFDPEFIRFVNKLEEWGLEMNLFMSNLKEFLWYSDYCR